MDANNNEDEEEVGHKDDMKKIERLREDLWPQGILRISKAQHPPVPQNGAKSIKTFKRMGWQIDIPSALGYKK